MAQGASGTCGDTVSCHNWGRGNATGPWWVEARRAANTLLCAAQPSTTKNQLAQNINRAEAEKPHTCSFLQERRKLLTLHSLPQKCPSPQSEVLLSVINVSSWAGLPSWCASTRYGALASGRPQLPTRPEAQTPKPVPPVANSYTHSPGVPPKCCHFLGQPPWDER